MTDLEQAEKKRRVRAVAAMINSRKSQFLTDRDRIIDALSKGPGMTHDIQARVNPTIGKRTIQRHLKILLVEGKVSRDKFGVYSVTSAVKNDPIFNAGLFGRACLDSLLYDFLHGVDTNEFERELPRRTQRLGILLTYLFLEALKPRMADKMDDFQQTQMKTRWIDSVISPDVLLYYFSHIIPESEKKKPSDSLHPGYPTYQELVEAFKKAYPEEFARLEHVRDDHYQLYDSKPLFSARPNREDKKSSPPSES